MNVQALLTDISKSVRMSPQYQRDVVEHWQKVYQNALVTNEMWTHNRHLTPTDLRSPNMLGVYFLSEMILDDSAIDPPITLNECMEQALQMVDYEINPRTWADLCASLQSIIRMAEESMT